MLSSSSSMEEVMVAVAGWVDGRCGRRKLLWWQSWCKEVTSKEREEKRTPLSDRAERKRA